MHCPECHNECSASSIYCDHCGAALISNATTRDVLPGERKQVTVLFSDLSGYTAMTGQLDPEDVKEIMGRILDGISTVIARYEGTIEKFVGDSVMAVFGAPVAHEDDPVRAIHSARQIHELVAAFSQQMEHRIGRKLVMHSGINTGLVVTGGAERVGTQGLVGDAINLAARLQGLAQADEILVGQETCHLASSHFIFEAIDPAQVKGKSEPVTAYKVLSQVPEPANVHHLQGVRSILIGREDHMALLAAAVQKLASGQGAIISIVGNAGTGKSRLVRDFKATLDKKQIQWREGHAYPYTQNTPYFPLINLLTHALQIQEGDTPDTIRTKVAENIKSLLWNRPEIIPFVGGLFSLDYPETDALSPEFRREKLKQSIADIFEALASRAPTVLLIEDLHWADSAFLQLLHQLLINTGWPMLFLLIYRPVFTLFPDGVPDNLAWPYQKIEVHDLNREHARLMLASLLKTDQPPLELEKFVQDQVEGNPFYLEEVINSLIEAKLLVQAKGQWAMTGPITQAAVPSTIQGVLAARLDRLEAQSKRILQQASVIGRAFYFEVLKRLSELGPHLPVCLSSLEKLDLIRARSLAPDLEYIFKHALTQEVVYNGLLKKDRKQLHERIARVMETLFVDRLHEFYEALAHHYQKGESIDKAIDYLIKSADKAQNQFCLQEAYGAYQSAHELLKSKQALTPEEQKILIDLLIDWAWVAYLMADFQIVQPLLNEYLPMAEHLCDRGKYGLLLAWYGWSIFMREGDQRGLAPLHQALEIAEEIKDKRLTAYCCTWLSWAYAYSDLKNKHLVYAQRAIQLAEELGTDHYLNHKALAAIAHGSSFSGQYKKGLAAAEKAVLYGKQASHLRGIAIGLYGISASLMATGKFSEALEAAETAHAAATDPLYAWIAKGQIAIACFYLGQIEKARDFFAAVVAQANASGGFGYSEFSSCMLGLFTFMSGQMQQGLEMMATAQQQIENKGQTSLVAISLLIKGLLFSELAFPHKKAGAQMVFKNWRFLIKYLPRAAHTAETCFHTGISAGHESGAFLFVALSHLELGKLFLHKKQWSKAEKNLLEAKRIFSDLENDFLLNQVEARLAKLNPSTSG